MSVIHYKIGGSVVTPGFGGVLHGELWALLGHKVNCWVCQGMQWMLSGEEAPGLRRELMLSFLGRSFPEKGEV